MKLYIKYMVSLRCKIVVKDEFAKLGLQCTTIDLGVVEIKGELSEEDTETLRTNLSKSGLELYTDKKSILSEQIRIAIIEMLYCDEISRVSSSEYLREKFDFDYTHLANVFSKATGITIQQFIMDSKIERVKELLSNSELSLTEIAYKLNYSSVAHLSNQFKKNTGLTPSAYKGFISGQHE